MRIVDIHDAQANLSALVDAAVGGEEIIIAHAGRSAVRLVAIAQGRAVRRFGALKGKLHISDDFDAPLEASLLDAFDGN